MIDTVQVLWSPAGATMPSLGGRALVDVTDGDTPNIRMPIRMLSVDTPEVTARTPAGAARADERFVQLAEWIRQGRAPISPGLAEYMLPRLETGKAGTLQFQQGSDASAFATANIAKRLARPDPDATPRNLFIRIADEPFDDNNRLLAYVAPDYTEKERQELPRAERSTFNLDLVTGGWAATFVIYPSIPGELDLPLLIQAAADARTAEKGIWADATTLLAYEYRAMEKLHTTTKKIVDDTPLRPAERFAWRERYCVDMRDRALHGPEDYLGVPPEYRLWIWPLDVGNAVGQLNLTPAPALVRAG
ncbi:MAG: thermonuclease family protein [Pseudonocardia sp.]